jgi:amino-acid N-acetyltransferase
MDTGPSKRELQQFLKRFGPEVKTSNPTLLSGFEEIKGAPGLKSPKEFVQDLLTPSYHQLALTKVEGPFDKSDWQCVGNTLYKLHKLGLSSIVVSDNPCWASDKSSSSELAKRMLRESMTLVESIEQAGGRARLIYGSALEGSHNTPNAIEINLDFILSALNNNQIPIIVPILTEPDGQLVPIKANSAIVALTDRLVKQAVDPKLVPSKIVVINKEGGIPNHELPGTAHSLVNVQEEYDAIEQAFSNNAEWKQSYSSTMENLTMIRDCLDQLPTASSAIIVPTTSLPSALITNLVTDKPLYSSSLPVTSNTQINQAKTTVLRHGIKINNFSNLADLNLDRLTNLLEASFQKKVNTDAFYGRLDQVLAGAIIAGDYEGAVIMTNEKADSTSLQTHAYLDKFAIAPSSQGIGLTDILWKRMCDRYPELLWRSRKDNGVNKW